MCGWYTSQFISLLHRRRQLGAEWKTHPRDSIREQLTTPLYAHFYSRYLIQAAPSQRSEVPSFKNDIEHGDYQVFYRAVPINNDNVQTDDTETDVQKKNNTTSSSPNVSKWVFRMECVLFTKKKNE